MSEQQAPYAAPFDQETFEAQHADVMRPDYSRLRTNSLASKLGSVALKLRDLGSPYAALLEACADRLVELDNELMRKDNRIEERDTHIRHLEGYCRCGTPKPTKH